MAKTKKVLPNITQEDEGGLYGDGEKIYRLVTFVPPQIEPTVTFNQLVPPGELVEGLVSKFKGFRRLLYEGGEPAKPQKRIITRKSRKEKPVVPGDIDLEQIEFKTAMGDEEHIVAYGIVSAADSSLRKALVALFYALGKSAGEVLTYIKSQPDSKAKETLLDILKEEMK